MVVIQSTKIRKHQKGVAYAETLVSFSVIALFLMGAQHVWRYAEFRQQMTDASRFAAWERTAWEPDDNTSEKFAIHQSNDSLARGILIHQFSTPAAWRDLRSNLQSSGLPAKTSFADDKNNLKSATKNFVSNGNDANKLVSVTTESGWPSAAERQFRGMDPTFGALTSLELDRDTYRTVKTEFRSQLNHTLASRVFSFLMTPVSTHKTLSLITNSWAASPAVNTVRSEYQLLPLSTGHVGSGTRPNNLAYFGMNGNYGLGLAPMWDLVGGANGLGGQYKVTQIGLDASAANGLISSAGKSWSVGTPFSPSTLLLKVERARSEYFQPNSTVVFEPRNTLVIDNSTLTSEDNKKKGSIADIARDASIGKRKYKAVSLSNPAETFSCPNCAD